jgi:hypothetical protein
MDVLFDIIIPVGPNDVSVIRNMVEYTKLNIIGYKNIYLVCYDPKLKIDGCITIDENIYPFNKHSIGEIIGHNERVGWYLQQLLKLYAGFVIDGILNNYLVIDSDTFFLRPTAFFSNRLPLYNTGSEYHQPYFEHMKNLHPTLTKQMNRSGICHHMMFQKNVLSHLFNMVEEYHHVPFYQAFLKCINQNHILGSGASEYEIYFNHLIINFPNSFRIRDLRWTNTSHFAEIPNTDYISVHWYMR